MIGYKSCVNSVNKGKLVKCQGKCDSQTCCEAIKTCDSYKSCNIKDKFVNKGKLVNCQGKCDFQTCCEMCKQTSSQKLQDTINTHWNCDGIFILRVWDSNEIYEDEYSQLSLSALQKSAVINGLYSLGYPLLVKPTSGVAGIIYNTWEPFNGTRIDCSFLFNSDTDGFGRQCLTKKIKCDTTNWVKPCGVTQDGKQRKPLSGPIVTSCKCNCRGRQGLNPNMNDFGVKYNSPVHLGIYPDPHPDKYPKLACTCGGITFGKEPDPEKNPIEAQTWRQKYLDYYKNLKPPASSIPSVYSLMSNLCAFRFTKNMMLVRNDLLKWLFNKDNPGVLNPFQPPENESKPVSNQCLYSFGTFNELAYGGNQMNRHAAFFYARPIGSPDFGKEPPQTEIQRVKNMKGFTKLPWVCIDNVATCKDATGDEDGKNRCTLKYDKNWNYPEIWNKLPELKFTVFNNVYDN